MKKVMLVDNKIAEIMKVIMLECMTMTQELMTLSPLEIGK